MSAVDGIIQVNSSRYGLLEVDASNVITFAEGLLGYPAEHSFALIEEAEIHPFSWLQSLQDPELAFVVVPVAALLAEFPLFSQPSQVMAIVTMSSDPGSITVNLQGPLLLDRTARTGKQYVLDSELFHTRHNLSMLVASAPGQ